MARNKYAKDYNLTEYTDRKGKVRTGYRYIGCTYTYIEDSKTVASAKKRLLICLLLGWVFAVAALLPRSGAMHTLYVVLPAAVCLAPLVILTDMTVSVLRLKQPFEHRHFDRINNNFPGACFILCLFAGFSLLGEVSVLARADVRTSGDVVFTVCMAALLGAGIGAFRSGKKLRLQVLPS